MTWAIAIGAWWLVSVPVGIAAGWWIRDDPMARGADRAAFPLNFNARRAAPIANTPARVFSSDRLMAKELPL